MNQLFVKIILLACALNIHGCAQYQKHFGGKSADYDKVITTDKIAYPAQINALQPSDRYNVPAARATDAAVDVNPPDYHQ